MPSWPPILSPNSRQPRLGRTSGFSLIEVLVALLIFVFVTLVAYQGFFAVAHMESRSREDADTRQDLFRAWYTVGQDLLHMRARPVRGQLGDAEPAYLAGREPYLIEFTRGGLPSLPVSPGGMMRVAYRLTDEGDLFRVTWPALDAPESVEPTELLLLSDLESVTFEHLGSDNFYVQPWPPVNLESPPLDLMPRMVRLRMRLQNGIEIERLLPGLTLPANFGSPAGGVVGGGGPADRDGDVTGDGRGST